MPLIAIARDEDEGYAPAGQHIGHWEHPHPREIDVEKRDIDLLGAGNVYCLVEPRGRADDRAAEFVEYVLDEHGDEHFIFDDQHAPSREITSTRSQSTPLCWEAADSFARLRCVHLDIISSSSRCLPFICVNARGTRAAPMPTSSSWTAPVGATVAAGAEIAGRLGG